MTEIIFPVNKIKNNVVNRNLSTKQYDEILTLLNNKLYIITLFVDCICILLIIFIYLYSCINLLMSFKFLK